MTTLAQIYSALCLLAISRAQPQYGDPTQSQLQNQNQNPPFGSSSSQPYDQFGRPNQNQNQNSPYGFSPGDRYNQSFGGNPSQPYDQFGRPNPYNPNNPYNSNNNNNNQQFGSNFSSDRSNQPFFNGSSINGSQFGRGPPYNTNDPQYQNRDRENQPYFSSNGSQFGGRSPPYYNPNDPNQQNSSGGGGGYGDQYGRGNQRNDSRYDRNGSQYGNYNQQYGSDNRDRPYGDNRDRPYGSDNRDRPYGSDNRDRPYGSDDRDRPYGSDNRDRPYGSDNRDRPYGDNRDRQYGDNNNSNNNRQYGDGNRQYGDSNRQYGNDNRPYGSSDQNFGQKDEHYGGGGGSIYGNGNDDCCKDYCYVTDETPYLNFATKTAYQVVYGQQTNQHKIGDCTPIQFWSINRHGTRLPSARTIERLRNLTAIHQAIIRNYDERRSYPDRGRLCSQDYELLSRWRWNETVVPQNANSLTSQGITDLKLLARRYYSRFDTLLKMPYSPQTYNFQYTDTDRTHDSYQAFIEGLFRDGSAYQVHANVLSDRLMRPTQNCKAWERQVDHNPDALYEYREFKRSQEYQQMVRDVFRRLGFRYTLDDKIIDDMYDMCRFEKAWNLDRKSAWCTVFNKDQLKVLEYAEDLKYYYRSGYGNEINQKVGCPLVKDLYDRFERTVMGSPDTNKVSIYFTHSATIQTFLTAMGLEKDQIPLTAKNYYQQSRRKWRTSTMDPFASNLAAALYQCRAGERYRVMFFLNENPVGYSDCSVGLCNWSTVEKQLRSVAENCNQDFCDQNAAVRLTHSGAIYLLLLAPLALFRRP